MPFSRDARQSAGAHDRGLPDLETRLLWLTIFRLVANSLSLGAIFIRLIDEAPRELSPGDMAGIVTVGLIYGLSLAYSIRLRFSVVGRTDAIVQVAGDILIASALVLITGGAESPFTFTFSVAVIGGALVLGPKAAMVAAVASLGLYVGVATAVQGEAVFAQIGGERLPASRFAFLMASNGLAISLVATLAAYLSRQLVSAGGQLVAKETEFENLEALQQRILLVMPSGLMTADGSGTVSFANPTALTILEQGVEEVIGAPLDQVIPGARELGPHAVRREIEVATPGGRRVLGLSITPMTEGERDILLVFQDLTELRRLERELQRSDRLAALGQLAAQLAHEIRNPLAAMRGSAQLLMKEVAGSEVGERLANILIRESDRLARLVDDSLRFARPAPPKRRHLSVTGLVEETAKMLRTDPLADGATIRLSTDAEVEASLDPDQMRQVLLNLMRNGLQAAGPGGELEIEVQSGGAFVYVSVWDSGGGIPKEVLPRLFEPFFTTRKGGTGLGLATAHAIVQAHGGALEVRPASRGGTLFSVKLPLNAPISIETPVPVGAEASARSQ